MTRNFKTFSFIAPFSKVYFCINLLLHAIVKARILKWEIEVTHKRKVTHKEVTHKRKICIEFEVLI